MCEHILQRYVLFQITHFMSAVVISNWKRTRDSYVRALNFGINFLIDVSMKNKIDIIN